MWDRFCNSTRLTIILIQGFRFRSVQLGFNRGNRSIKRYEFGLLTLIIKMYLENIMKNLFAIIVLFLGSSYLYAAPPSVSASTNSDSSLRDKLSSFSPSVKIVTKQKELTSKTGGKVSISRRSESSKNRSVDLYSKTSTPVKKLRDEFPVISSHAFGFSFYSATSFLDVDLDGDGYYSQFGIDFDADLDTAEFADVYAIIYYSENGGPWTEFFVTEDFTLFSDDIGDEYSVTFILNSDFPTNQYDFLIDLYEVGFSDIVATIGPEEDSDLFALPLEDEINDTSISFVASDLFGDFDTDGFYTDLTLEYDIETQRIGDTVYAEIAIINLAEGWQQILFSDNFSLGNQTEFIDLTFNEGYPAGYYDIQLNLIDVITGEVIADAGQEFSSLRGLPIESVNNDNFFDGPDTHVDVDVDVHHSGSMGWWIVLLGLMGLVRRRG